MNKERRATLTKAAALMNEARVLIEQARDEEQDFFDNMPESLQGGDKGQRAEEVIDSLTTIVDQLDEYDGDISSAME